MTENTDERTDERVYDLHELMTRGADYREKREFELFGKKTEIWMKPMVDEVNIPLSAMLHLKFDMDVEEAREHVEEQRDDEGEIDVSAMDDEFVEIMKRAARESVDYEKNGWTEEQFHEMFGNPDAADEEDRRTKSIGGVVVEIGMEGFELAGTLDDAKLFRGRGTQ